MTETKISGSCLCSAIRYSVVGTADKFYYCYCSRCRKSSGSSHSANLFMTGSLNWDQGQDLVKSFKLPDAKSFSNHVCEKCGSRLPNTIPANHSVKIPAGSLNDEPPIKPTARIFQDSRPEWTCGNADVPVFDEYPD